MHLLREGARHSSPEEVALGFRCSRSVGFQTSDALQQQNHLLLLPTDFTGQWQEIYEPNTIGSLKTIHSFKKRKGFVNKTKKNNNIVFLSWCGLKLFEWWENFKIKHNLRVTSHLPNNSKTLDILWTLENVTDIWYLASKHLDWRSKPTAMSLEAYILSTLVCGKHRQSK